MIFPLGQKKDLRNWSPPFFRNLVIDEVIGIKIASDFAFLSLPEQEMLLPYKESITSNKVMTDAKSIVKANIPQENYGQASEILQESFDLHKEFSGKTELIRKALEEYQKAHPDEK